MVEAWKVSKCIRGTNNGTEAETTYKSNERNYTGAERETEKGTETETVTETNGTGASEPNRIKASGTGRRQVPPVPAPLAARRASLSAAENSSVAALCRHLSPISLASRGGPHLPPRRPAPSRPAPNGTALSQAAAECGLSYHSTPGGLPLLQPELLCAFFRLISVKKLFLPEYSHFSNLYVSLDKLLLLCSYVFQWV